MSGRAAVPADLFKEETLTPKQHQAVADYLGQFIWPEETAFGQKCPECESYFTGTLGLNNLETVHMAGIPGEGACYECGHPFRYVHDIPGVGKLEGVPLMFVRRDRS